MSNNKQSSVEWLIDNLYLKDSLKWEEILKQAKVIEQEQAQLYTIFVLKCIQNNLPPITFNDWINLENNEQQ